MEKFDTYKSQLKDGDHRHWNSTGDTTSVGKYKNGKEEGKWITYDEFGEILYVNYYRNGNPCHVISNKIFSCDEEEYGYEYSNDELEEIEHEKIMDGEFTEYLENRDISSVLNYKNGKLHGECVSYYDGIPGIGYGLVFCKGEYSNGKRHGEFVWVNEDGTIKEIKEYDDGKLVNEIPDISKSNNKQKIYLGGWGKYELGYYKDRKKTGLWTRYYKDG